MKISKKAKLIAILLTSTLVGNITTYASEITGVTGNNGVFDINPSALINGTDIGYRKYKDFTLDKNDIANLIFKYGVTDVSTFINLVDNQISIDGLVNSMRDGGFYNGKAIFISPNGMIVGASGVLNVGSLSITTPTQDSYNFYKANPNANISGLYETNSNATVKIDGKVIATNNIDISSGNIIISKTGSMVAGTNNNTLVTSHNQADTLFNSIVNTSKIQNANNLSTTNGNIVIKSGIQTEVSGDIIASKDINITNIGTGGVNVKGLVNAGQNVNIDNKNSNVVIGDNTDNNNYVTAGNDINIVVVDGSILNYGVEKTLLNAAGNLNMNVTDGTIGLGVQQTACQGSGCTGVGPKADGSRDFTKSINANIKGKVNATTTNTDPMKP